VALGDGVFAAVRGVDGFDYLDSQGDKAHIRSLGRRYGAYSCSYLGGRKRGGLTMTFAAGQFVRVRRDYDGTVYAIANRNNITVLKGGDKNVC
jgi:hypothetical protein